MPFGLMKACFVVIAVERGAAATSDGALAELLTVAQIRVDADAVVRSIRACVECAIADVACARDPVVAVRGGSSDTAGNGIAALGAVAEDSVGTCRIARDIRACIFGIAAQVVGTCDPVCAVGWQACGTAGQRVAALGAVAEAAVVADDLRPW